MDVLGPYVCMAAAVTTFLAIAVILAHVGARDDRDRRRAGAAAVPWSPDNVWQPFGRTVVVAGRRIPGGLLYVGQRLQDAQGRQAEPALIDPTLLVSDAPAPPEADIGYWPSYTRLRPEQRATYLGWLAGGRTRPSIAIGYVWLYFYGLERRLLSGMRDLAESRAERVRLVCEVQRLRSLYGGDAAFAGYAARLLDYMEVLDLGEPSTRPAPHEHLPVDESVMLRYVLGRLAADGHPVPWHWALAWFLAHPDAHVRAPARVCQDEFRALFRIRYGEAYGPGLTIAPASETFAVQYKPASPSFGGLLVEAPLGRVPDVVRLKRTFRRVAAIAEACQESLASYSAWVQANPTERGTEEAWGLLPSALRGPKAVRCSAHPGLDSTAGSAGETLDAPSPRHRLRRPRLAPGPETDTARCRDRPVAPEAPTAQRSPAERDRSLRELASGRRPGEFWCTPVERVLEALGGRPNLGPTSADASSAAGLLQTLGLGMEPDTRFGGPSIDGEREVVLFNLPPGSPSTPSAAYVAATLELRLLLVVARADWHICERERAFIVAHLRSCASLTRSERTRLTAHSAWLLRLGPRLDGLALASPRLSAAKARVLGRLLVGAAAADGRISDSELRALRQVYRALGRDPAEVDADVKAVAGAGETRVEAAGLSPAESPPRETPSPLSPPVRALSPEPGAAEAPVRPPQPDGAEPLATLVETPGESDGYALPRPPAPARGKPSTAQEHADTGSGTQAVQPGLPPARVAEPSPGAAPPQYWAPPSNARSGPRDAYRPLDMERVRALEEEDGTSALLRDLLGEEEELGAWVAEDESRADRTQTVAGLDQPHSDLVRALADHAHLARDEFGRIAERLDLLPEGALHTINDAAYGIGDDPLVDGDEELTVNHEVLERMLA